MQTGSIVNWEEKGQYNYHAARVNSKAVVYLGYSLFLGI